MVKAGLGGLVPRCQMGLCTTFVQRAPYSLVDPCMQGVPVLGRLVTPQPRTIAGRPMPEAQQRRMV